MFSYLLLILKTLFQKFALGKSARNCTLLVEGAGSCSASPLHPGKCSTSYFVHRGALAIHQRQPRTSGFAAAEEGLNYTHFPVSRARCSASQLCVADVLAMQAQMSSLIENLAFSG